MSVRNDVSNVLKYIHVNNTLILTGATRSCFPELKSNKHIFGLIVSKFYLIQLKFSIE